jgi:anti-sigma B factor antagonist
MRQRITPWPWLRRPIRPDGRTVRRRHAWPGGLVNLKLGHYNKDGIEVIDVGGEIDIYTAPRLRELLIDLVSKDNYQLIVNLERVEFLDSTGLAVLVGGLKRVRAHDGSLDPVCTQERILKIFRITGLTKVFGIQATVDQAIAAKGEQQSPGAK